MTNPTANSTNSVIRNPITSLLPGILVCAIGSSTLHAGVVFTFTQVGSDVVATTSGTIASGWNESFGSTFNQTSNQGAVASDGLRGVVPGGLLFSDTAGDWRIVNRMNGIVSSLDGTTTGDTFGYAGASSFYVPQGTAEGAAITPNTTITWANRTIADMDLDTWLSSTPLVLFELDNGETISAVLGNVSAVPGASLAGLATVGLAGVSRRQRR